MWPEGPGFLLGAGVGVTRVTGFRRAVTLLDKGGFRGDAAVIGHWTTRQALLAEVVVTWPLFAVVVVATAFVVFRYGEEQRRALSSWRRDDDGCWRDGVESLSQYGFVSRCHEVSGR